MYRVINQTGQGFKAHERHFESMRSAWGLRPAPSFVHGWGMPALVVLFVRGRRGRWIQHTLLTKRTHPWRIRTHLNATPGFCGKQTGFADSSGCRSQDCGSYATRWSWGRKHATAMPGGAAAVGKRFWRLGERISPQSRGSRPRALRARKRQRRGCGGAGVGGRGPGHPYARVCAPRSGRPFVERPNARDSGSYRAPRALTSGKGESRALSVGSQAPAGSR